MIGCFRRIFLPIFTILSLLLFVLTVALAIRSYWYVDRFNFLLNGSCWSGYVASYPGQWFIQITCDEKPWDEPTWFEFSSDRLDSRGFPVGESEIIHPEDHGWAGFDCYWDSIPESTVTPLSLKLPQWFFPLLLALLPGWWVGRKVQKRFASLKDELRLCPQCRYDLRAHQPGQKCPECGTLITSSALQQLPALPVKRGDNVTVDRSYHIDEANSFGEPPHVDVNRPKIYNGSLDEKKYPR